MELYFINAQTTFPYKEVFDRLKCLNKRLQFVVLDENDWEMAGNICKRLEIFL